MHARIEHLLGLRDGEPIAAEVSEHVKVCPVCTGELQRLAALRAEMQALPQFEPPAMAWERIREAIPKRNHVMAPRKVGVAAAIAATITLTVIAAVARYSDYRSVETASELLPPEPPARVDELVAQSQHLEQLLRILPERPRVERVSTAATIDTIEQRIQWLDFQLTSAPHGGFNEEQSRQLWRERVELMDSLVKVRYAEAGGLWF